MCDNWNVNVNVDDVGPEDWGLACDSPDYDYEEYEEISSYPGDFSVWEDDEEPAAPDYDTQRRTTLSLRTSRRASIIHWLSRSDMATSFKSGAGFSISGGYLVRLIDGSVHDLVEWLRREGIRDGVYAAGYGVREDRHHDNEVTRLSFYRVVDAPFHNLDGTRRDDDYDEDDLEDIPF